MTEEELDRLIHQLRELRRELNSARREICNMRMPCLDSQKGFAKGRGWDCYKEENDNA